MAQYLLSVWHDEDYIDAFETTPPEVIERLADADDLPFEGDAGLRLDAGADGLAGRFFHRRADVRNHLRMRTQQTNQRQGQLLLFEIGAQRLAGLVLIADQIE